MEILKKGQYIENKYTGEKLLLYRLVSVFKGFGCEIEFVGSDYLFYFIRQMARRKSEI
jgi:hypothetical protein